MTEDIFIDDQRLVLELNNKKPVELLDLTESYISFAELYKSRTEKNPNLKHIVEPKLYVKEIKSGSIITELIDYAPLLFPFVENANSVIEFFKFLKNVYELLREGKNEQIEITKTECNNLSKIISPVVKDNGSQLNISTIINGGVTNNYLITNESAVQLDTRINNYKTLLSEIENNVHHKVLMYWYQVRDEIHAQAGDKAKIESITPKPLKVIFANDDLKQKILEDSGNFFKYAYIVDVELQTMDNKPVLYKVIEIHDKIDKEELI